MRLSDALETTGCAIFTNNQCVTSVERLPDEIFLLMTRRGVCIIQCRIVTEEVILKQYPEQQWMPARVEHVREITYVYAPSLGLIPAKIGPDGLPIIVQ